jgi:hypothetical protein
VGHKPNRQIIENSLVEVPAELTLLEPARNVQLFHPACRHRKANCTSRSAQPSRDGASSSQGPGWPERGGWPGLSLPATKQTVNGRARILSERWRATCNSSIRRAIITPPRTPRLGAAFQEQVRRVTAPAGLQW